ncbi:MAG: response regulator transcription factor [Candidatus Marinimicrobia bacterium]|nr:response regulator transcription factor [Candidatus Neomarinimicrobiota bacterium]MBL7022432.1 response regulator transcription factor [Candidatus Neomarinimicrobiota bacterium]MBL7108713.1 response regulator transcription factor [Candidatus Neomarinimicrobiota bacterium]
MIKILLVDDHAIVREGLKRIIDETMGMQVTGEANNGSEALKEVWTNKYDLILLDISMPGGPNGLDVLKEIKSFDKNIPVLMLSMHSEDQYAKRTLKAGASGYVTKDGASDLLVKAIRRVNDGGKFISPHLAEILAEDIGQDSNKAPHELLSDREYEVLCLIASGKTISEIASQLFLSVKTISTYRSRILEKMNIKTNAEMTYYAISNSLVE